MAEAVGTSSCPPITWDLGLILEIYMDINIIWLELVNDQLCNHQPLIDSDGPDRGHFWSLKQAMTDIEVNCPATVLPETRQ